MTPSGMDDHQQDGLLASGEHTPIPFLSALAGHTPSEAVGAAPASEIFAEVAVSCELPKVVPISTIATNFFIALKRVSEGARTGNFHLGRFVVMYSPV